MKPRRRSPPHPSPLPAGERETSGQRRSTVLRTGLAREGELYARKPRIAIRPATADDMEFILSLVPRFASFALPKGRRKRDVLAAIHKDVEHALRERPAGSHFFVSEDFRGDRTGFLQLQVQRDFFSGARVCHVSDLAIAKDHDGQGIGRALLAHAESWASTRHCKLLTLSVFPGNARARALYERAGFRTELLRMAKPLKD